MPIQFSLNGPSGAEQVGRMPHYVTDIINSSIVFKTTITATLAGWTGLAVGSMEGVEAWLRLLSLAGTVLITFSTLFMIWYRFLHGKNKSNKTQRGRKKK